MVGSRVELKAFLAEMQNLYDMLAFVRSEAEKTGFDAPYISKIELAVEEALVNIISYAYSEKSHTRSIHIECTGLLNKGIQILIRDQGIPYNPLEYKNTVKPEASLEEREMGGYGIFFITRLMDEVQYKRDSDLNVLTLVKYLPE